MVLTSTEISTPLGTMIAIADEQALYMLQFADAHNIQNMINKLQNDTKSVLAIGTTLPLQLVNEELQAYFCGKLRTFNTPVCLLGTSFQKQTWAALQKIPYGTKSSYLQQANAINNPQAYRAVANANKANRLAIILPCHRICKNDGSLCGYNGGIERKQWLIEHERFFFNLLAK